MERGLLLRTLARVFDARGQESFDTVPLVGRRLWPPTRFLRSRPTMGTVLQPIVEELNRRGRQIEGRVGDVMDAIPLTRREVHRIACSCDLGPSVKGVTVASSLRMLALGPLPS